MKGSFGILICIVATGCNNSGTNETQHDSSGRSSTLPPETNYVMENNVNETIKKNAANNKENDTSGKVMTSAIDTTVSYLVDSVAVKK